MSFRQFQGDADTRSRVDGNTRAGNNAHHFFGPVSTSVKGGAP